MLSSILVHFYLEHFFLDDEGVRTFSIAETLYQSVIKRECIFDSETFSEVSDDQSVTHLDSVSG